MKTPGKRGIVGPIELHAGQQLRHARTARHMSQESLGIIVGLTPQQIQKYELGRNSLKVGRLKQFADALGTDINYFVAGLPDGLPQEPLRALSSDAFRIAQSFDLLSHPQQEVVSGLVKTLLHENGELSTPPASTTLPTE